ncbi:MAG: PAS domain-containing protein [Candidatus Omnitrophica bacterium]|nr:PAS domain-containing protein [Candidatus Omnitrophota bacterium]
MVNNRTPKSFSIVCVGASAGGLEALSVLFNSLPKNINMAFVLIQHLEPQHKSALADILSRETSLNIREAKNHTNIEPAHIYVIPPNTLMAISKGNLEITTRIKRADGKYLPVDFFMASLAKDQGENAIGVILSGTGSDGTLGAKEIKAKGGIIFVQDENSAKYFGMPGSAIASGAVDFILDPRQIAKKLAQIGIGGVKKLLKSLKPLEPLEGGLTRILVLLKDLMGVDFTHYKQTTINRRIVRRMTFHNIKNYTDYYNYLKKNPSEIDVLRKDILIPVTEFFRDPDVFTALKKKVFPLLVNDFSGQGPIRIWVPACSTGEEAYSLAISLYEFMEEKSIKPNIQVFGTDLSERVIEKARSGVYTKDISANASPDRLRKFFTKTDAGYKIAKHIRDLCIFAKQDITNDPPLSNMDIVSCRNLLIYLDTFLQNKALSMMHYAIKPKGFLVLGSAESVTSVPDLFTAVDRKYKIYSKNVVSRKQLLNARTPTAASKKPLTKGHKTAKKVTGKPFILIQTKKRGAPSKPVGAGKKNSGNSEKDIAKLKKEFARTVERLNAISEEKDTFNEELKAANEEIQSSNEELQSMNEELETSKEELQSTNEELLTLNGELQNNNKELTRLNSDLSNVFASTNIPIIMVGNDLRIKRFTPTARKMMNLIPSDVGRPVGDIKLNIDIANLEDKVLDIIEDMTPKEYEVKDKENRWYSMRIRPYRTVDNKIDGAVIAMVDIDALKKSENSAQDALEYIRAVIRTMKEPLLILDKDAKILSANKAFYQMFKVQVPDVENKLLFELGGHQWDCPELRKMLGEILLKKSHFEGFEMSFDFPKIGQKTMILNGRQIKMRDKDNQLILLVIEDITQRKKAEDVLKRDRKTLQELIKAGSEELVGLQTKLERSKYLSDIGTLAATVAHELRNTLAAINAAAYSIRRKIKDPSVEGSLNNINKKIIEGGQIINNVLLYSKIKTSDFKSVKINDIFDLCVNDVKTIALSRGIAITNNLDDTKDLFIEADSVQIQEVFCNILNNALDAVSKDSGKIEIESKVNGSIVSVSIKDNGEGIEKEHLEKVIDPFFTTKAKGTGLGLAVCNQIILLHDGSLVIESEKGKGTTVKITLPIHRKNNAKENFTNR